MKTTERMFSTQGIERYAIMNKRTVSMFVLTLIALLLLSCCEDTSKKTQEEDIEMKNKTMFAMKLYLSNNADTGGDAIEAYNSGRFTECVFVNSKEDAAQYGDDIIVAWPSDNTEGILRNFNKYISDENIDLASFSLAYPITLKDVLENWEQVDQFIESLDQSNRAYLLAPWRAPSE